MTDSSSLGIIFTYLSLSKNRNGFMIKGLNVPRQANSTELLAVYSGKQN